MKGLALTCALAAAACSSAPTGDCGAGCADGAAGDLSQPSGPTGAPCATSAPGECFCGTLPLPPGAPAIDHCDPAQVGTPALCCATAGWPADPKACNCWQLACTATSDLCLCSVVGNTTAIGGSPVASCSGGLCCKGPSGCSCRQEPGATCFTDEVVVPSCSISDLVCNPISEPVTVASCG